jgi:hypothetical protein
MKIIFPLLVLSIFGCHRVDPEPIGPYILPQPVFMLIKEKGVRLPDQTLNRLFLTYHENGQKKYVKDFSRGTDGFDTLGIMSSVDIRILSADKQIRDFYLEYPDGDVDTIFADYEKVAGKEAAGNSCYCTTPLKALKFNGKTAILDTSIKVAQVYLIPKK